MEPIMEPEPAYNNPAPSSHVELNDDDVRQAD